MSATVDPLPRSEVISVAVLAVHPPRVAATRLRAAQFAGPLAAYGIEVRLWSFLRESDLEGWYGPSHVRRFLIILKALLKLPRLVRVVQGSRVVVVQREGLPLGPPLVEWLASRGRRLVWDVDDAVWESFESPTAGRVPQWLRATGGKYQWLCRRADEVWAGSEVLAAWCGRYNPKTVVVPTVVEVPEALPEQRSDRTIGWIGSHSTGPFLEAVLPAVTAAGRDAEVVVVGARPAIPTGARVRVLDWSMRTEQEALNRMRVGLYPIDRRHPLADGKCGLKAILYMAHGVPCVVTPTPANTNIVRENVDGLYADSPEQWTYAVGRLLDDDALWLSISRSAHRRAYDHFSVQTWTPLLAQRLRALAGCG